MPAGKMTKRSGRQYKFNPKKKASKNKARQAKAAYKKTNKKKMIKRRAPLVETKRKTHEDLRAAGFFSGTGTNPVQDHMIFTAYNTEHIHMNPLTYLLWSQGLSQTQHIGQNVLVKHINMKVQVRFPQPSMEVAGDKQIIPQLPQHYELVWGWIPAPYQFTGSTTPAANNVSLDQLKSHINLRVVDYFNTRKDFLRFIPKKDSTIRIVGRRHIRPDMRFQSTAPPNTIDPAVGADYSVGTIPDFNTEISWKTPNAGKKLWLEQTGNIDGGDKLIAMYPNYSWLPFCVLVNWNYDELLSAHPTNTILYCPSVAWNDITYFTDS